MGLLENWADQVIQLRNNPSFYGCSVRKTTCTKIICREHNRNILDHENEKLVDFFLEL